MKATLESTPTIMEINGVRCRLWEGTTESGIKIHAFVARVGVPEGEDHTEFQRELETHGQPTLDIPSGLRVRW